MVPAYIRQGGGGGDRQNTQIKSTQGANKGIVYKSAGGVQFPSGGADTTPRPEGTRERRSF